MGNSSSFLPEPVCNEIHRYVAERLENNMISWEEIQKDLCVNFDSVRKQSLSPNTAFQSKLFPRLRAYFSQMSKNEIGLTDDVYNQVCKQCMHIASCCYEQNKTVLESTPPPPLLPRSNDVPPTPRKSHHTGMTYEGTPRKLIYTETDY